jgi:hypothetical protein
MPEKNPTPKPIAKVKQVETPIVPQATQKENPIPKPIVKVEQAENPTVPQITQKENPVPKPIAKVKQVEKPTVPQITQKENPVPKPIAKVKQAETPTVPQITQKKSATIKDMGLIESLHYLKQNNLLPESKSTIKFETVKEAEDAKKEEIIDVIKEKVNAIKQDITALQKAGHNLHLETIRLIAVPLKQKVWLSTLAKKDLENIFNIFKDVNLIVVPLKKENEAKVAEKERLEKITNQEKRQETKVTQEDIAPKASKPNPPSPKPAVKIRQPPVAKTPQATPSVTPLSNKPKQ